MDGEKGDAENLTSGDCVFHVGGEQCKLIVKEKKDFLAARSLAFERMFEGDFLDESPINITDVEPEAFFIMLKFLHDEPYCFSSKELAMEVMHAAEKYILVELKEKCEEFLMPKSIEDVWFVAGCAYKYYSTTLTEAIREIFSKHTADFILEEHFLEANEELVLDVVQLDTVTNVTEFQIFNAVFNWAKNQATEEGTASNNPELLLQKLQKVLKHIRLPTMTASEKSEVTEMLKLNVREEGATSLLSTSQNNTHRKLKTGSVKNEQYPFVQVTACSPAATELCYRKKTLQEVVKVVRRANLISIIVPSMMAGSDSCCSYYWEDLQVSVNWEAPNYFSGSYPYGCGVFKGFVNYGQEIHIPIVSSCKIDSFEAKSEKPLVFKIKINFNCKGLYPWQSVRDFPAGSLVKNEAVSSGFIIGYRFTPL